MLRYDVEELVRDWLVSGRKRGEFAAMVWDNCKSALTYEISNCLKGWCDVFGSYHTGSAAPRRAFPSQRDSDCASNNGGVDDGREGYPKHGDTSGSRCGESTGIAQRREEYIYNWDGGRLAAQDDKLSCM